MKTDENKAYQARPHTTLLAELMDSNVPKSEREHAAVKRIEELEKAIDREITRMMDQRIEHLQTFVERDEARRKVTKLEGELIDSEYNAHNLRLEISYRGDALREKFAQIETLKVELSQIKKVKNNTVSTLLPRGWKIYGCTNCKEINVKKDNRQITVGNCDNCGHALWNDDVD